MAKKIPSNEYFIEEAVKYAQLIGKKKGFKQGQVVAHPSDSYTYLFVKIEGDTVKVEIPAKKSKTGKIVQKTLPIEGLFDPNIANDKAILLKAEFILKNPPTIQ